MAYRIIKGTWFDATGFIDDLNGDELHVDIDSDNVIRDTQNQDAVWTISTDRTELRSNFFVPYFVPDAGELARIGL